KAHIGGDLRLDRAWYCEVASSCRRTAGRSPQLDRVVACIPLRVTGNDEQVGAVDVERRIDACVAAAVRVVVVGGNQVAFGIGQGDERVEGQAGNADGDPVTFEASDGEDIDIAAVLEVLTVISRQRARYGLTSRQTRHLEQVVVRWPKGLLRYGAAKQDDGCQD